LIAPDFVTRLGPLKGGPGASKQEVYARLSNLTGFETVDIYMPSSTPYFNNRTLLPTELPTVHPVTLRSNPIGYSDFPSTFETDHLNWGHIVDLNLRKSSVSVIEAYAILQCLPALVSLDAVVYLCHQDFLRELECSTIVHHTLRKLTLSICIQGHFLLPHLVLPALTEFIWEKLARIAGVCVMAHEGISCEEMMALWDLFVRSACTLRSFFLLQSHFPTPPPPLTSNSSLEVESTFLEMLSHIPTLTSFSVRPSVFHADEISGTRLLAKLSETFTLANGHRMWTLLPILRHFDYAGLGELVTDESIEAFVKKRCLGPQRMFPFIPHNRFF
jgi:hypothetical protein